MMLKSDLLALVLNGENSGVEFKRDDIRPEQLARECVAFANARGGKVLLGVEDDGRISGLTRPATEEWVMNVFRDSIRPQIIPYYEEVVVSENGPRVAVVTVEMGTQKPYVLCSAGREDIYIRMGSTCQLATREQQARLFQSGHMLHVEALPVSGSSFADLDERRLRDYLERVIQDSDIPLTIDEWEVRLCRLGLMTASQHGGRVCTIAGLVLFGTQPRRLQRQSGLRLMVFRGSDMEYDAVLDDVLDSALVDLNRANDGNEFLEAGLLSWAMDTLRPYVSSEEITEGTIRRERQWDYPSEVLREALVNAFAHRDWTRAEDVELVIYSDRCEITSPGSLPNSMDVDKMKAGQRSPRNNIIVEVLRDYGYMEHRGMGVRRKMIPLMREHNGTEPQFEITDDYVRVRLLKGQPIA